MMPCNQAPHTSPAPAPAACTCSQRSSPLPAAALQQQPTHDAQRSLPSPQRHPQTSQAYLPVRPPTLPAASVHYMAQVTALQGMPGMLQVAHMAPAPPCPGAAPKRVRDLQGREEQIRRTVYVGYIDPQVRPPGQRALLRRWPQLGDLLHVAGPLLHGPSWGTCYM
jgi:hypothetical protein